MTEAAITQHRPTLAHPLPNASNTPDGIMLGRRRVYILPTRHGLSFALLLLVMLLGSINYDNSMGYMLTFLLTSLSMVSILHTYRNLAGLTVRGGKVKPVFVGAEARFGLCLDNRDGPARHAVCVRYSSGFGEHIGSQQAVLSTAIPANQVQWLELPVAAARRGWLRLGCITLATRYPLGLFRAWSRVELHQACLVFPRPAGHRELPVSRAYAPGEGATTLGPGKDDFFGFRDYLPGDSPRRIYWKAVARERGMPVKLFTGIRPRNLTLCWEDVGGNDTETRISQLCMWVQEAKRLQLGYGLQLPGTTIAPNTGERHQYRCLKALALFRAGVEIPGG